MEPRQVLVHLSKYLLECEKQEILEKDLIYYINVFERKGTTLQNPDGVENNGFDNDKGEYICDIHDHLDFRYEIVKRIGKGSFGQVFRCFDHMKKEFVACKILRNKKRLYKQGLIECKILEHLKRNDPDDKKNIIRIIDNFVFRKHLILNFEMLSMNLYEFLKMNNF
jgi:dual specificity tyrosine-phosphorylation-regulated kinase 2/3/4